MNIFNREQLILESKVYYLQNINSPGISCSWCDEEVEEKAVGVDGWIYHPHCGDMVMMGKLLFGDNMIEEIVDKIRRGLKGEAI